MNVHYLCSLKSTSSSLINYGTVYKVIIIPVICWRQHDFSMKTSAYREQTYLGVSPEKDEAFIHEDVALGSQGTYSGTFPSYFELCTQTTTENKIPAHKKRSLNTSVICTSERRSLDSVQIYGTYLYYVNLLAFAFMCTSFNLK